MKKLLTLCLGFIPCAALAATNKISMVTFFPVPYVAYSQLKATDQMDIGLTNSCDMTLGCSEASATLNAAQVNVKGGKLNLDGGRGIKGNTLSLGNGNGEGKISFQKVRIQTGNMESVNAQDIKAANLNLFGKAFPSCKNANDKSGGQMQWASLKLKGASSNELYLACGEVLAAAGCPNQPTQLTRTRDCPSGQTGKITETWDETICDWVTKTNTCTAVSTCRWVKKTTLTKECSYSPVTSGCFGDRSVISCFESSGLNNYTYYITCPNASNLFLSNNWSEYQDLSGDLPSSCDSYDVSMGPRRLIKSFRMAKTFAGNWSWEGTPDKGVAEIDLYECKCN